jgi:hypothetical protein
MTSIYLEAVVDTKKEDYNKDWSVCGQFAVVISNPDNPRYFFTNRKNYQPRSFFFFFESNQLIIIQ